MDQIDQEWMDLEDFDLDKAECEFTHTHTAMKELSMQLSES